MMRRPTSCTQRHKPLKAGSVCAICRCWRRARMINAEPSPAAHVSAAGAASKQLIARPDAEPAAGERCRSRPRLVDRRKKGTLNKRRLKGLVLSIGGLEDIEAAARPITPFTPLRSVIANDTGKLSAPCNHLIVANRSTRAQVRSVSPVRTASRERHCKPRRNNWGERRWLVARYLVAVTRNGSALPF